MTKIKNSNIRVHICAYIHLYRTWCKAEIINFLYNLCPEASDAHRIEIYDSLFISMLCTLFFNYFMQQNMKRFTTMIHSKFCKKNIREKRYNLQWKLRRLI